MRIIVLGGAGALDTGVPLAIAGHMLGSGAISLHGSFGPEVCIPLAPFFAEIARYNLHMTSQITKL